MPENNTVSRNKKAFHDYFVVESFEAGIELFGTEIKSIRQGAVNLKDSWCSVDDGELFANGIHRATSLTATLTASVSCSCTSAR